MSSAEKVSENSWRSLMVRPVYSHELTDPDFAWLITSFNEEFPGYILVDNPGSAVVFIKVSEPEEIKTPEIEKKLRTP